MPAGIYKRRSLEDRFREKVSTGDRDDCWRWTGSTNGIGYGIISVNNRHVLAHRVAWELAHGPIPKGDGYHGTCVLHKCDHPWCVNEAHLFLGTIRDNHNDMYAKGRGLTGERNGQHKLTETEVIAIRTDTHSTNTELARVFGVKHQAVSKIRRGQRWAHVSVGGPADE